MRGPAFMLLTVHALPLLAACGSGSRETSSLSTDAGKDTGDAMLVQANTGAATVTVTITPP
jgi:hypothetical protein